MAKPKAISSAVAREIIDKPKFWLPSAGFPWAQTTVKKFPSAYKLRAGLEVEAGGGRVEPEGLFVDCYYKKSLIHGVPDTLSLTLLVQNARVFGLDENGPSSHINRIGAGMPYYQQQVSHPHIHIPVDEACYGYAEPIPAQSIEELWTLFLKQANIHEAPDIVLPGTTESTNQLELL